MLHIGSHLSAAKGFTHMAQEAVSIGANTFQFFTRNPRGFAAKDIDPEDIAQFHAYIADKGFAPILAHAPYTLNACSADAHTRELAQMIMEDDLKRMEHVPHNYYNFHPGSHVGQGAETGIRKIAQILNAVLTDGQSTTVLLETMSGKGSEVGRNFEEIRAILDLVDKKDKMGVCLDTCHVWDGGYDIVNDLDGVLEEFDRIIGLEKLKAVHLNDSMNEMGSHKDRHAKIGEGHIGLEALVRVISHPALQGIPFILETPNDDEGWTKEIRLLRESAENLVL